MKKVYQNFFPDARTGLPIFLLVCILFTAGCSRQSETTVSAGSRNITNNSEVIRKESDPAADSGGTKSSPKRGLTRQLSEAGAAVEEHPAAGMKRPDKWKDAKKPAAANVTRAGEKSLLEEEVKAQLARASIQQAKVYLTERPISEVVDLYRESSSRSRVSEKDGTSTVVIPVQEGMFIVNATPHETNGTIVSELLIPEGAQEGSVEWARSLYEEAARKR